MVGLRWRFRSRAPVEAADRGTDASSAQHATAASEVEFSAYAEDCRVFGFLQLAAERMSDELGEHESYDLNSVLIVALADGRATEVSELTVRRDEVLAVRSAGPRGNPGRRRRTRPSPVSVKTGPYLIHGYLHGPPGADPLLQVRRRKPMVPLTEAWIEYLANGENHRARVGTIIVNRDLIDWIHLSRDAEVRVVGLPLETSIDAHAKDFTGYIRSSEG